jgi:ParB family chromosome partitioning protein
MNFLAAVKNHQETERRVDSMVTGNENRRATSDVRRAEYLMAKVVRATTLPRSQDSPFDKLILRPSYVARIKPEMSVLDLPKNIARRSLNLSLNMRGVLADDQNGKFEIPSGGRLFPPLSLLVKQKRLAKTTPIPCIMQGVALHPFYLFPAFASLPDKGQTGAT